MQGIWWNWISVWLLSRKYSSNLRSEFEATNAKLIKSFISFRIKPIIKNNFDLKPTIFKLFFSAFWIDAIFTVLTAGANFIYTEGFIYDFLDCQISGITLNWPLIGSLIIHILFFLFMIRIISDAYKLSLRGNYRNIYLKLLFLDILTLNVLSVIGIFIFIKFKNWMIDFSNDFEVNQNKLHSSLINDYFKSILKIEVSLFFINLFIFLIALLVGYFTKNNIIKLICLGVTTWNVFLFYGCILYRISGIIIVSIMFKKLLTVNNYSLLFSIIRFLLFILSYHHVAILINLLAINGYSKEFILENL